MSVSAIFICAIAPAECNADTRDPVSIKPRLIIRHMYKDRGLLHGLALHGYKYRVQGTGYIYVEYAYSLIGKR